MTDVARRFRRDTDLDGKFRDVAETRPEPRLEPDPPGYTPVTAADVTDPALLPGEMRHYRNETNDRLERIESSVTDIKADIASIKTLLTDLVKPRKARGKR